MDNSQLRHLYDSVKTFLLSKMSREALVFGFFCFMSAGFWLIQALNEMVDINLEFDLVLDNVPEGTVITSELPSPIHVMVHDKGTSLIRYALPWNRRQVAIDFQRRSLPNGRVVVPQSEVIHQLQLLLDASTRIVSIHPDTLEYYFSKGDGKRVPVEFVGRVVTEPSTYLANLTQKPDSVTVWADSKLLDSLQVIYTENTLLTDLDRSAQFVVPLVVPKGVKVEPKEIKLMAEVDTYTEKKVQVPIVGTNFPGDLTLRTFPPSATVTFLVGSLDYNKVTADNFVLTATYEELMQLDDSLLQLRLRSVPEGVSRVTIQPEYVQFLIEQVESDE